VLPADLLRRRILGRHRLNGRLRRDRLTGARVDEFRDTEVEELQLAVARDEDVRRFEIAVDDQVLVRVLHDVAHGGKELESRVDRETACIAIAVDRFTIDILHREPRYAVTCDAAVDEAGDVWVLEKRENPTLLQESSNELGTPGLPDQLERDALLELSVVTRGEEHGAHTSVTDLSNDAEWADAFWRDARMQQVRAADERLCERETSPRQLEEILRRTVSFEQALHRGSQRRVAATCVIEEHLTIICRLVERRFQQAIDLAEAFGR
jgi:hypothetical protein